MELRKSVWATAKQITAQFEGGSVSSNADGQGISMGIIQWNLGQNTLQPILKECFTTYPDLASKMGLEDFKNALFNGNAFQYAVDVFNGGGKRLVSPWKERLKALNYSNEFQSISDKYCDDYKNQAISLCKKYDLFTDRAFALFFDIAVENWNCRQPIDMSLPYIDKMVAITKAVSDQSRPEFKEDVLQRKLAIVYGKDMGRGWNPNIIFEDRMGFNDDANHWALKYWYYCNDYGIKINSKLFNDDVTRGEFFVLCARALGVNEASIQQVPGQHYATIYWYFLNDHGIKISEMKYDDLIKRGEVFKILALMKGSGELIASQNEHWSQPYFEFLINNGIKISDTKFENKITRGEVICLLARYRGSKE